ncbi:hypothetical protein HUZ36_18470 [Pseudoalteromonas sp. McH1-7]|uniref:Secreted protein n=1 Tax=Pseudoalteromonas peptidolytica F12-50-A1 TaxID=1315280 RepID=A0A8I0MUN4_9GAMM|nr:MULTISPECIES: hypothetical protein [Pseudoalteromonas]MBE0345803.1 hypothetical protein [Pseudoalteromonas peptidolytica F12-50-A1]MDW7547888.1 hypothetical protein [Pseudoalteromonas peptidolytica]NLR14410.1 hypothetical protein [Pseudoalteromonas peptidolytica]NUZ12767.1 hypothetical protein [Pseudoalteromonas sp. McH1-7]USD27511.1 hypothetical protein J8Z24_11115 [Pseudoalteromonas sp. SCSIO 43201]
MTTLAKLTMTTLLLTASMTTTATEIDDSILQDVKSKISQAISESIKANIEELRIETKQSLQAAFQAENTNKKDEKEKRND